MGKFIDLTGQKFGRLTVLYREDVFKKSGKKETAYVCQCDCGAIKRVFAYGLKSGNTQSCGCKSLENRIKARTTHHKTGTRIYRIWRGMKTRCENPNDYHYEFYGKRGIKVCDEWQKFEPFYQWAMESGYTEKLSLDRIDNNGNYEPHNCRWATIKEQCNNRRTSRFITYNNVSHTLAEWASIANMRPDTLAYRINNGWPMDKALNAPVRRLANGHYIT